jgi:hypothetical protein
MAKKSVGDLGKGDLEVWDCSLLRMVGTSLQLNLDMSYVTCFVACVEGCVGRCPQGIRRNPLHVTVSAKTAGNPASNRMQAYAFECQAANYVGASYVPLQLD